MKTYPITLSESELKIITAGLGELPMKHSAPVLQSLQNQVRAFEAKQAESAKEPGDKAA